MNNFVKEEVMKILRDETKQYFERQDQHIHELETFQEKQRFQIRKMEKDRLEQLLLVAELKSYQEIQNNNIHELQVKLQIQTETLKEITKICEHDKNQNKYSINHRNGYMHRPKENYTNENKPLNLGSQENITANLHKWSLQKNMENDSTTEVAHDVKRTDKLHLDIGQDVMVAFYAYMSASEPSPGQHHTFIFDSIMTNSGSGYNKHNGMFTVPNHGHYVFTWTVISARHGWVYSEIVINSSPLGSILTDSDDTNERAYRNRYNCSRSEPGRCSIHTHQSKNSYSGRNS
ncbi:unnamed protein product [Mytilus edulis]|uniref:C1q domain-containing protein n=1 Tax=Mytilus edulis TaxID=6550 RepID=A0A8S3QK20_MYTED|nr:unnamed protein product [Mytilus edulis]